FGADGSGEYKLATASWSLRVRSSGCSETCPQRPARVRGSLMRTNPDQPCLALGAPEPGHRSRYLAAADGGFRAGVPRGPGDLAGRVADHVLAPPDAGFSARLANLAAAASQRAAA